MRLLVTGGLGFLGSQVANALALLGHQVRVLDDASRAGTAGVSELFHSIEVRRGDVRDPATARESCRDMDVVLHLAAVQGTATFYRSPDRVLDVNVGGTLEIVRAVASEHVRRLLFASSSEVYATPLHVPTTEDVPVVVPDLQNPRYSYGGSKIVGELLAINFGRARGFEPTILRYHNVYGPRMGWDHVIPQFITRLERGETFSVQGDGTQTRAFCYVSDAVDATVRAALRPEAAGQTFNVGNDEREWSINEVIALLTEVSGRFVTPVYGPPAAGGTTRRAPDITRARRLLGYEPRVPLREGLLETYLWYREAIARGLAAVNA